MEIKYITLLVFGLLFNVDHVISEDLESRLSALEEKFNKMEGFFKGFDQLCSTISDIKSSLENEFGDNKQQTDAEKSVIESKVLEKHNRTIFMSGIISTDFIDDDVVAVTVVFRVIEDYMLEWHYRHENNTSARLKGKQFVQDLGAEGREVTATVLLNDIDTLRFLIIVIETKHNQVKLTFDIDKVPGNGSWAFPRELERKIYKYKHIVELPDVILKTEGVKTTIEVSENVVELLNSQHSIVSTFYRGINTTSVPVEYIGMTDALTTDVKNGSGNELVIGIDKKFAQFGGILTVLIDQGPQGFLRGYEYGVSLRIVNEAVNDIMPAGSVAIHKPNKVSYYYGPYLSYTCIGAGIPPPDINILKLNKDGALEEMTADEDTSFDNVRVKALNFNPRSNAASDGTYTCRVSNEHGYAEFTSSIVKYVDVTFDQQKTGIMKATPEVTIISCKASGTPTPVLDLRVNDNWGESLLEKIKPKVSTKRNSYRVTVKISPQDPNIHSVVCVAIQVLGKDQVIERYHTIHVKDI